MNWSVRKCNILPVLAGDYTTCLKFLMRYPASADVQYIIQLALHLRNPKVSYSSLMQYDHSSCIAVFIFFPLLTFLLPSQCYSNIQDHQGTPAQPHTTYLRWGDGQMYTGDPSTIQHHKHGPQVCPGQHNRWCAVCSLSHVLSVYPFEFHYVCKGRKLKVNIRESKVIVSERAEP